MQQSLMFEINLVLSNAKRSLTVRQIRHWVFYRRYRAFIEENGGARTRLPCLMRPSDAEIESALTCLVHHQRKVRSRTIYPKGPWGGVQDTTFELIPQRAAA